MCLMGQVAYATIGGLKERVEHWDLRPGASVVARVSAWLKLLAWSAVWLLCIGSIAGAYTKVAHPSEPAALALAGCRERAPAHACTCIATAQSRLDSSLASHQGHLSSARVINLSLGNASDWPLFLASEAACTSTPIGFKGSSLSSAQPAGCQGSTKGPQCFQGQGGGGAMAWGPQGGGGLMAGLRVGEALKPGPPEGPAKAGLKQIASINITAWYPALPLVSRLGASVVAVQEHSVGLADLQVARAAARKEGFEAYLSPPDPETLAPSGGVGILVKKPLGSQPVKANTEAYEKASQAGRALLCMVALGGRCPAMVGSFYGWASQEKGEDKYARTSELMDALVRETLHWDSLPVFLLGDMNAPLERVAAMHHFVEVGAFHDAGAIASAWGGVDFAPTAQAHNSDRQTRIDYVFMNSAAVSLTKQWHMHDFGVFDVHRTLSFSVDTGVPKPVRQHMKVKAVPLEGVPKERIALAIAAEFVKAHDKLQALVLLDDMTQFFQEWTHAYEEGLAAAARLRPGQLKDFVGRGAPVFKRISPQWAQAVQSQPDSPAAATEPLAVSGMLLKLKRCCIHLAQLARKARPRPREQWGVEQVRAWHALMHRASQLKELNDHQVSLPSLQEHVTPWYNVIVACKLFALRIDKVAKAISLKESIAKRKHLRATLEQPTGIAIAYRLLKGPPPRKLLALKGPTGVTACPDEVDRLARAAWGAVYQGNLPICSRWQHAFGFATKYRDLLDHLKREPFPLPPLDHRRVADEFRKLPMSAPGPDSFHVSDLKCMTDLAAMHLTRMYMAIEAGAKWPDQLKWARVVFLGKGTGASVEAYEFRLLSICSLLYRRWSAMRLHDMEPWIEQWAEPGMFGGFKQRATDEAFWSVALDQELATLQHCHTSMLSVDVHKAFDQMSRELVYLLAANMGAPKEVIAPWLEIMGNLQVFNVLASSAGEPYSRPLAIPQGCALSMIWLAVITRPMNLIAAQLGAKPRSLADDFSITTSGDSHWRKLQDAGEATLGYLSDAGARVSHAKSVNSSTSPIVRAHMRLHRWRAIDRRIPVLLHFRDLGAHASMGKRRVAGTLSGRMYSAATVVRKIGKLPAHVERRALLVKTKGMAMGLYGCEVTPVTSGPMRALVGATKEAIGLGTAPACNPALLFATFGVKTPDPRFAVIERRVKLLRRMYHNPVYHPKVCETLAHHIDAGRAGTLGDEALASVAWLNDHIVSQLQAPESPGPEVKALGPIQLALISMAELGLRVARDWRVFASYEVVCSLVLDPWPVLRELLLDAFNRMMVKQVSSARASMQGGAQIDWRATCRSIREREPSQRGLLRAIMAGGLWSDHERHKASMAESPTCMACKAERGDIKHLLWHCPCYEDLRAKVRELAQGVDADAFPCTLSCHGLATVLPANDGPFTPAQPPVAAFDALIADLFPGGALGPWCTDILVGKALRGATPCDWEAQVPHVAQALPMAANLFTDGSVTRPLSSVFRKGGCGFSLALGLEALPLSDLGDFGDFTHGARQNRQARWASLLGPAVSSTRAEAVALMIGMLIPQALTVATDSQGVIHRFSRIAQMKAPHRRPDEERSNLNGRGPWGVDSKPNANDADVWIAIRRILHARGPGVTQLQKVPAHLPFSAVGEGLITGQEWWGNNTADVAAKDGSADRPPYISQVIAHLLKKQHARLEFLKAAHTMYIGILRRDTAARRTHAFSLRRGKLPAPVGTLRAPGGAVLEVRRFTGVIAGVGGGSAPVVAGSRCVSACMQQFVCNIEWQDTAGVLVPWLVLLVLFELHFNVTMITSGCLQRTAIDPRLPVRPLVAAFKSQFGAIVRDCVHPADRHHFKSLSSGVHVLQGLAYAGCMAGVRAFPSVSAATLKQATIGLVKLRASLPRAWQEALEEGLLELPRAPVNLKAPPRWRASGRGGVVVAPGGTRAQAYTIRCPAGCGSTVVLKGKPLVEKSSWPKVKCAACQKIRRCGTALCMTCRRPVASCLCFVGPGNPPDRGPRQSDIRAFFARL